MFLYKTTHVTAKPYILGDFHLSPQNEHMIAVNSYTFNVKGNSLYIDLCHKSLVWSANRFRFFFVCQVIFNNMSCFYRGI